MLTWLGSVLFSFSGLFLKVERQEYSDEEIATTESSLGLEQGNFDDFQVTHARGYSKYRHCR